VNEDREINEEPESGVQEKDGDTVTTFSTTVHQNAYLPPGEALVHALVAFSAQDKESDSAGESVRASDGVEVIVLDSSDSMGSPPSKIEAARRATCKAIDKLPEGTWFAIVAGTSFARLVFPPGDAGPGSGISGLSLARASKVTRAAAKEAVSAVRPGGGTAISTWLAMVRLLIQAFPGGMHHAIFLADGKNEGENSTRLAAELERCRGKLQGDCLGVGTDWDRAELQSISDALLGTTEIVPRPAEMDGLLEAVLDRAMNRRLGPVALHVLTPVGGGVEFIRQVSPEIVSLTGTATRQQPNNRGTEWRAVQDVDPQKPLLSVYPTGAWARDEEREYHICLSVTPQEIGDQNEIRAARVSLVIDGRPAAQTPVRALWTDDLYESSRLDRAIAHYTGQEDLARSIELGLDAKRQGDHTIAVRELGRAARLAHLTGNEPTTRLLERVVEIQDARAGTVRLRPDVTKEAEMTLDTRARRTVRLRKEAAAP
jgi:hypothetical protein